MDHIELTQHALHVEKATHRVASSAAGAISSFIGMHVGGCMHVGG